MNVLRGRRRSLTAAVGVIAVVVAVLAVLCSLSPFVCFWITAAANTIFLFLGSAALGLLIGFFLGWARSTGRRALSVPAGLYVEIFRGIPRILIIILTIVIFPLLGLGIDFVVIWGIVALGVSSGAYQAEVFRSGFQSIPHGQIEAAQSIGLSYWQTMQYVTLPQVVRTILPPLGNEWIIVLKDTSLIVLLPGIPGLFPGVFELMARARFLQAVIFDVTLWPLIFLGTALVYLALTLLISRGIQLMEERYRVPGLGVLAT